MESSYIVAVPLVGGPCKGETVYMGTDGLLIYNPLAALRMSLVEAEDQASKLANGFVLDWAIN